MKQFSTMCLAQEDLPSNPSPHTQFSLPSVNPRFFLKSSPSKVYIVPCGTCLHSWLLHTRWTENLHSTQLPFPRLNGQSTVLVRAVPLRGRRCRGCKTQTTPLFAFLPIRSTQMPS